MLVSILSNFPYFMLLYLSIYDINFKEYLENLLRGLSLSEYYKTASIWVVPKSKTVEESITISNESGVVNTVIPIYYS